MWYHLLFPQCYSVFHDKKKSLARLILSLHIELHFREMDLQVLVMVVFNL